MEEGAYDTSDSVKGSGFLAPPTTKILHVFLPDEELDFIINYDIKYRMGDELEGDGE